MTMKNEFYTYRGYQIKQDEKLTVSMEDYLEMIYRICLNEGYTRINQLADNLNVKASSASKIVQKLAALGLVKYEKYSIIQLTEKGKDKGRYLLERHKTIEEFLNNIGVKKEMAFRDTELLEHHLSKETYERISAVNQFLKDNPDILEKIRSI